MFAFWGLKELELTVAERWCTLTHFFLYSCILFFKKWFIWSIALIVCWVSVHGENLSFIFLPRLIQNSFLRMAFEKNLCPRCRTLYILGSSLIQKQRCVFVICSPKTLVCLAYFLFNTFLSFVKNLLNKLVGVPIWWRQQSEANTCHASLFDVQIPTEKFLWVHELKENHCNLGLTICYPGSIASWIKWSSNLMVQDWAKEPTTPGSCERKRRNRQVLVFWPISC